MKLFIVFALCCAFLPLAVAGDELSTAWILRQIDAHGITSLESLLGRFSPKSLERHVLAYGSESLQFASFQTPRVIVYSYDGDFLMAFNGEPGSAGYHDLEILSFDHAKSAFHGELIRFDPAGKRKPRFDPAPTNCARCHQTDLRPNWDPYFHWVGFYGSEDDNQNAGYDHPEGILAKGREHDEYGKFLARRQREIASGAGRYRFLPKHPAKRPNEDLNQRIICLNMKRLVRALLAHPESPRIWPHLYKGRIAVDELPRDLLARATRPYADVRQETDRVIHAAMTRRVKRHVELTGEPPRGRVRDIAVKTPAEYDTSYELDMVAGWRFVFEEILKEPFRPYSTSRHVDYHLNLDSITSLMSIAAQSTTDPRTGAVVLNHEPQERPRDPYGYDCPRSPHYYQLRIADPKR